MAPQKSHCCCRGSGRRLDWRADRSRIRHTVGDRGVSPPPALPTLLTHPAVPLALATTRGSGATSQRLLVAAVVCSELPDVDSLGYFAGIPYDHVFGHRGISHSILFAALIAALGAASSSLLRAKPLWSFLLLLSSTASHGILDAMTDGGLGVAFLSPFSNHRFFFAWRPIPVSPLGIGHFFSSDTVALLVGELLFVWLPCLLVAATALSIRRLRTV